MHDYIGIHLERIIIADNGREVTVT